jgi:hypothetical protein
MQLHLKTGKSRLIKALKLLKAIRLIPIAPLSGEIQGLVEWV